MSPPASRVVKNSHVSGVANSVLLEKKSQKFAENCEKEFF